MMDRSFNSEKQADQLRVTDRRRVHLNEGETEHLDEKVEEPSLKPTYVEELEARTKAAEKRVEEMQSRFDQLRQQLQKEAEETRRRLNRAAAEAAQREKADFVAALLPVGDNLGRAIQAAESGGSIDTVVSGIRATASSFENALASVGVEAIDSVGQDFDPQFHEAVDTVEVEDERQGKVISEYSRGFKIGERLLRPARVQVGRASEETREAHS